MARARAETRGCERVIHLNNAGAALPPTPVMAAVLGHLRLEEQIGGYEAAAAAAPATSHTYQAVAALLGCGTDEIALVENATRAWDMAFYSMNFQPGDRILTARAEYVSNVLALLQVSRRTGATIEVVEDDRHGQFSVADLERRLDSDVKLVAMTHVPTGGGLINPAAEVGALTRAAGVPFLLDACQSVGQLSVKVEEIGCDMLSATGRKFLRGPRGTGFLYVRRELIEQLEPPFLDLHAANWTGPDQYEILPDARRFENWEGYVAGKIGLGVAVDYALSWGLDAIAERVQMLAESLRQRLRQQPGVTVHDLGRQRGAIVTFTVAGVGCDVVRRALGAARVNVSVTAATSAQLDLPRRGLTEVVRASVHYYNTEAELDRMVARLPAPSRPG